MWQKARGIWKYVHDHFLQDYDYFYIAGDDVYVLVDNFRAYLNELTALDDDHDDTMVQQQSKPRHFGSWLPAKSMIAGGPGYTLNRAALQQFVNNNNSNDTTSNSTSSSSTSTNTSTSTSTSTSTTNNVWSHCLPDKHQSYEDRFMSHCMSEYLGIRGNDTDTRDRHTGEQRFHDTDPATLYLFRAAKSLSETRRSSSYFSRMAKSWEDQPMPKKNKLNNNSNDDDDDKNINININTVVGPRHELEAAAKYSISLHRIHTPTYMARIHAILYPTTTCPADSPLGRGLQRHYIQ